MSIIFGFVLGAIIVAVLIAAVTAVALIIAFIGKKETRWRRLFIAGVTPAAAIVSFVGCMAFFNLIISLAVGVDFGIGDHYYVPLENGYSLHCIDVLSSGDIQDAKDNAIATDITHIAMDSGMVYGSCSNDIDFRDGSFVLNTVDGSCHSQPIDTQNLTSVSDYYYQRYREVAGLWMILAAIVSLVVAGCVVWLIVRCVKR